MLILCLICNEVKIKETEVLLEVMFTSSMLLFLNPNPVSESVCLPLMLNLVTKSYKFFLLSQRKLSCFRSEQEFQRIKKSQLSN